MLDVRLVHILRKCAAGSIQEAELLLNYMSVDHDNEFEIKNNYVSRTEYWEGRRDGMVYLANAILHNLYEELDNYSEENKHGING